MDTSNGGEQPVKIGFTKGVGSLEVEVLQVLWEAGRTTSREVFETIHDQRRVGYSTVLTALRRLVDRGVVKREPGPDGYIYSPLVSRQQMGGSIVDEVVDRIFGGAVQPLLSHLLERTQAASVEDMLKMKAELGVDKAK
jgi:BlaI family transcriptional regulator, penicillinase repressor